MITKQKNYKLRLVTVLLLFFFLFLIISVRLYLTQIHRKNFFRNLASQQYAAEITSFPPRAIIYDRYNNPLTINTEAISTFILPQQFENPKKTKKILKQHFKHVYKRLKKQPNKKFLWLNRKLSEKEASDIKKYNCPDIHFIEEPKRFYPYQSLATLIGFTNIDNKGIEGIELQCNKLLNGSPTKYQIEKDARNNSFYFKKHIIKQGKEGTPVTLTIDNTLQFLAYEELKETIEKYEANSGSVVIMNPETGEILAMASYPDIDPNKKITNINDIEKSKNISITECHEPGSIIKTFATLAAFEENVVTFDEEIDCGGKVAYIDGFRVKNPSWKPIDTIPFWQAIQKSSNIGVAKVVKRLGTKFYDHLKKLGFGETTGIQFPGERNGFVNPPHKWSKPSLIVLSFGYEINGTILQLAKAFSIIANGGYNIQPTLFKNDIGHKKNAPLYKQESIELTKDVLETIGIKYGVDGYRVMGKTGTARCIKDGKYTNKEHVYSFGGIVEKDDYKRVIITFINRPKNPYLWAAQLTAPFFKRIAEKMVIHDITNNT